MSTTPKKILIIDDEDDVLQVVKKLLELNDYEVVTASSGEEGIKVSKEEQPNLVLMDITMPGIDGFTAAMAIKTDTDTAHIPILMLTIDDSIDNISKAYSLKIDGYVVKDLINVMLIDRITATLKAAQES